MKPKRPDGFALVAVLSCLALVTAITMAALAVARSSASSAVAIEHRARNMALAEAGLRYGMWTLINTPPRDWSGIPSRRVSVSGRTVNVSFQAEVGKISLNAADEDLLSAAFAASGVPANTARRLGAAIVDWRDDDNLRRPAGAEAPDYRSDGYDHAPRNGPFQTVGELMQVRGMTRRIFHCTYPLFTVYSNHPHVDQQAATPAVRSVLSWAAANEWMASGPTSRAGGPSVVGGSRGRAGAAIAILAAAQGASRSPVRMRAIVRLTRDGNRPASVLSWQEVFEGERPGASCDSKQ